MKYASLLMLVLLPLPAIAQEPTHWKFDAEKSTLTFSVAYGKDKVEGAFPGFSAEIAFSPNEPEHGRINVSVPVANFTSYDYDARENLPEEAWLDTKHYKQATFISDDIAKTGENAYLAIGMLTLRDSAKPLELPFTLTLSEDGKHAMAEGKAILSRMAYGIGRGEEETAEMLGDAVTVTFRVEAERF